MLAFLGMVVGWNLLPDQVTLLGQVAGESVYRMPKLRALGLNFGLTAVMCALFWKWPREPICLLGVVVGVVLTFLILPLNLGV